MKRLLTLSAALAALAALALPAGAALAEPHAEHDPNLTAFTQHIGYTDAALSSAAGRKDLLQRIELAADEVCGGAPSASSGYSARLDYAACKSAAMTETVAAVRSPALAAQFAGASLMLMARN